MPPKIRSVAPASALRREKDSYVVIRPHQLQNGTTMTLHRYDVRDVYAVACTTNFDDTLTETRAHVALTRGVV